MIIYITGASGSGKSTLLKHISVPGYDLDTIYENNWKKHRKVETVQKGVKKDIEALVAKHKDVVFVGLQGKDDLTFTPDIIYILIRKDFEDYYRQKLVRDLNLLCKYKKDYEEILQKQPFDQFHNYFWSNSVVNMKSLAEFKEFVEKQNKNLKKDFPKAALLTVDEIQKELKKL